MRKKKSDVYWQGRTRTPPSASKPNEQDKKVPPLSPIEERIFSSYEFWHAVTEAIQKRVTRQRDKAVLEFQKSGLTPEEFNARHCRDDGELFPAIESGEMKIMSVIKMPEGWGTRRKIDPERVLKLYHENLSLADIAKSLNRTEKWVKQSLSKFGIRFDRLGSRVDPNDIPFGWSEKNGKLVASPSEQWVLDKLEEDFRSGKTAQDLCKFLNQLKVRPRTGKSWVEPMVTKAVSANKRLKSVLAIPPK